MKGLITTHKKELERYTDLDLTAIERITYLHDFDREVQYVILLRDRVRTWLTMVAGAQHGDTLPSTRTTVMPRLQTPCCRSGYPSWPFRPPMTRYAAYAPVSRNSALLTCEIDCRQCRTSLRGVQAEPKHDYDYDFARRPPLLVRDWRDQMAPASCKSQHPRA